MAHRRAVKALVSFLPLLMLGPACSQKSGSPNTAVTAATHTAFPITTGVHAVDCSVCHGQFSTFKQFTCTNCHGHDVQATTDLLHTTVANYTYSGSSCYQCHPTGARQPFDHAGITATTPGGCAQCHDIGATFAALPVPGFTHVTISSDCSSCHVSTTSWSTAAAPQFGQDPSQQVTVTALLPTYSSSSMMSVTQTSDSLVMPMNHAATAADATAMAACSNCHTGAVPYPGNFHSTLDNMGLPQPTSCIECHGAVAQAAAMTPAWQLVPTGIVGPAATSPARIPSSGEMKHDAVSWVNGARTQTALVSLECGTCHSSPNQKTQGWNVSLAGTTPAKYHPALTSAGRAFQVG